MQINLKNTFAKRNTLGAILHIFLLTICTLWSSPTASADVIKLHSQRAVGQQITINVSGTGKSYKVTGATPALITAGEHTLTLTSQEVSIEGDEITFFNCSDNELDKLDVTSCTSLEELLCYENSLQELKLDKNVNLVSLSCDTNQLEKLELKKNVNLKDLLCNNNALKELDLSNLSKLKSLYCFRNQLSSLYLPKDNLLEEILCSSNELSSLDLGKSPHLTLLECYHNNLLALDLSQAPHLKKLSAKNNQLKRLDLTTNGELTELLCSNNQLEEIKTTANAPLLGISCYNNKMSGVAMSQLMSNLRNIKGLSISVDDGGEIIAVNTDNSKEGNVCYKSDVQRLKEKGWKVSDFNGSYMDRKEYDGVDDPVAVNTIRLKSDAEEITLTFDVEEVDKVIVSGAEKKSQETIEQDVVITCSVTPQEEVVIKGDVTLFDCAASSITELQVANHTTLTWLVWHTNKLTSLNTSGCTSLEEIDVHSNQLTTADFTGCASVSLLDCSSNQIKEQGMEQLIATLYNRSAENKKSDLYVINSLDSNEGNVCTIDQVAKATSLGWATYYQEKEGQWTLYPGSKPSGLDDLSIASDRKPIAIYDAMGRLRSYIEPGYNIVVFSDGSTLKLYQE